MIQTKSKLRVRDNSGRVEGTVLNGRSRDLRLGDTFSIAYGRRSSGRQNRARGERSGRVGRALLVQSRQTLSRYDGSTYRFTSNGCVTIGRSGHGLNLGFRRIAGSVPFELNVSRDPRLNVTNLPRLARGCF